MKILITGVNGYVGSSLYRGLKDQYDVVGISRQDVDLTDSDKVNQYFSDKWFDVVIHCSVKGGNRLEEDGWSIMDGNLIMYYNLLHNKNKFGKFIHLGSGAEYSQSNKPYGLSKRVISRSIDGQDNFYNLRIYAVFDELELDRRFIKANLKRYIDRTDMEIHQNKYMDFFYMEDMIKLVKYYLSNKDLPKHVDCTYSENLTLKDIAEFINTLDSYRVWINMPKDNKLVEGYVGFNKNIKLDYVGLKQGIINTYNKLKCNQ
jgi:GDP-L-fucose synthase